MSTSISATDIEVAYVLKNEEEQERIEEFRKLNEEFLRDIIKDEVDRP